METISYLERETFLKGTHTHKNNILCVCVCVSTSYTQVPSWDFLLVGFYPHVSYLFINVEAQTVCVQSPSSSRQNSKCWMNKSGLGPIHSTWICFFKCGLMFNLQLTLLLGLSLKLSVSYFCAASGRRMKMSGSSTTMAVMFLDSTKMADAFCNHWCCTHVCLLRRVFILMESIE